VVASTTGGISDSVQTGSTSIFAGDGAVCIVVSEQPAKAIAAATNLTTLEVVELLAE
jgi:hypothetical protein